MSTAKPSSARPDGAVLEEAAMGAAATAGDELENQLDAFALPESLA